MIKRFYLVLLSVLLCALIFAFPCFADDEQGKTVYDGANLFSDSEIALIEQTARECFGNSDCSVYIVTAKGGIYGSVNYYGEHFIDQHLDGNAGNSVILIITDNAYKNYDIYTYGKCDRLISDSEINEILDNELIYDNIKLNEKPATAAVQFIKMSADACESEIGLAILIGCIFGLVASGAVAGFILYEYNKKLRSEKYPLDRFASLDLVQRNDFFMGKFVTRRRINTSGGRRGGRGGRMGGGGGGGHRGGR